MLMYFNEGYCLVCFFFLLTKELEFYIFENRRKETILIVISFE